jgi:hypothetical protein
MRTTEDHAVARGHRVDEIDPACWQQLWDQPWGRVAGRFGRADLRWRPRGSYTDCWPTCPANCRTIAEHAGDRTPDGMQHLLARAVWNHDAIRDDIRDFVVEPLLQRVHKRILTQRLSWHVRVVRWWVETALLTPTLLLVL